MEKYIVCGWWSRSVFGLVRCILLGNCSDFTRELQRFHQLQAEYLFIVNNDIKTVEDLFWYKATKEMRQEKIEVRQKELYRKISVKKRECKTVEDIREYQIWHMDVKTELDALKQEKREIKENLKLVDDCLREKLYTACFDITDMEERIRNTVDLPEYSYGKNERVWDDSGKKEIADVSYVSNVPKVSETSEISDTVENGYANKTESVAPQISLDNLYETSIKENGVDIYEDTKEKVENPVLSVVKRGINEAVKATQEDVHRDILADKIMPEPVNIREIPVTDKATTDSKNENKLTYEAYCRMKPEEKAKAAGFVRMRSFDTVKNVVNLLFYEMGHETGVSEIMAEVKVLYEGMEKYVIELRVSEILKDLSKMEVAYRHLTDKEKAELFDFQMENNDYNLKLYFAVMKAVGIKLSMDEMYEDYQGIYDKTVEMQMEKEACRKNEERGRGR